VTQSALNTASSVAAAATALQELLLALPDQLASGDLQQKAASTSTLLRAVMDSMQQQWVGVPWHTKLAAYAASTLGLMLLVRQQQQQQEQTADKQEQSAWPSFEAAAAAGGGGDSSSGAWPTPAGKAALAVARGNELWLEGELAPGDRAAAAAGAAGGWDGANGSFLRAMPASSWGHGTSANASGSSSTAGGNAGRKVAASAGAVGKASTPAGAVAPSKAADRATSSKGQQNTKYTVTMRALANTSTTPGKPAGAGATAAGTAATGPQGGSPAAAAAKQEAERAQVRWPCCCAALSGQACIISLATQKTSLHQQNVYITNLQTAPLLARASCPHPSSRLTAHQLQLKDRLHWACLAMGPLASVVPGGEPVREQVDRIIQSLEALNPCSEPLGTVSKPLSLSLTAGAVPSPAGRSGTKAGDAVAPGAPVLVGTGGGVVTLSGNWRLMYASNSTTMVSTLLQI
jgi:hypothetical protein